LSFNAFKAEAREVATLSSGLISDATERPSDRLFWSLDYDWDLVGGWHSHINLSENQSDVAATTEYDATDQVVEWIFHSEYGDIQHDVGLNLHRNELILPDGTRASEVTYKAVFYQINTQVTHDSRMTAGLQVMDPEKSSVQLAPRLALNTQWNEQLHSKLIYGRAYSSPTGVEFSLNIPNLFIASDRLLPTVTDSYEAQLIFQREDWMTSAGVYYSTEEDGIELVEVVPGQALPKQFQNIDTIYYRGIELEGRMDLSQQLLMQGSYSLQRSNSETESSLLSRHLLKLGVSYQPGHGFQMGLFNVFHSQSSNREPLANEFNPKEADFSHMTANFEYEVLRDWNQVSVRLTGYIDNLLNEDAEFLPDPILSNLNTMPKVAGRSYYFGIQLNY
jgi:outer membrane receptor for ferrienterochelin and colicin